MPEAKVEVAAESTPIAAAVESSAVVAPSEPEAHDVKEVVPDVAEGGDGAAEAEPAAEALVEAAGGEAAAPQCDE